MQIQLGPSLLSLTVAANALKQKQISLASPAPFQATCCLCASALGRGRERAKKWAQPELEITNLRSGQ